MSLRPSAPALAGRLVQHHRGGAGRVLRGAADPLGRGDDPFVAQVAVAAAAGVEVVAYSYDAEWDYWQWHTSTFSDESGAYQLTDLPGGEYKVQFAAAAVPQDDE